MIKYFLNNNKSININFEDFIFVTANGEKYYKKDFSDFSQLIYLLDTNIMTVRELVFDNTQYFLNNGILSDLYYPSEYVYSEFSGEMYPIYFFKGFRLYYGINNSVKSLDNLLKEKVFYYKNEIRNLKERIFIDIHYERKKELRIKKLERLI